MVLSKIAVLIGGFLSLALFLFHTKLYALFGWQKEFTKISVLNGKIIYTVNLALTLLFLFCSIISFVYFNELARCGGRSGHETCNLIKQKTRYKSAKAMLI